MTIVIITTLKTFIILLSVIILEILGPINAPINDPGSINSGNHSYTPSRANELNCPLPPATIILTAAVTSFSNSDVTAAFLRLIDKPITSKGINNTPPEKPNEPDKNPTTVPKKGSDHNGNFLFLNLSFTLIRIKTKRTITAYISSKYGFIASVLRSGDK